MEHKWKEDVALPKDAKDALAAFCEEVVEAAGDQLDAIILYGGITKGEYNEDTSDVNILLALKDINLEILDNIAPCVQHGRRDVRIAPMLLSDKDLKRSTDVFPIKFLDIKEHHTLLWGTDVLEALPIEQEHLRLRCEQELKNLNLRLRSFYIQRINRAERIEQTLVQILPPFLISMDALLYLKDGKHYVTKDAIISATKDVLGLENKVLRTLLSIKLGQHEAKLDELRTIYESFMKIVDQAADIADQIEE